MSEQHRTIRKRICLALQSGGSHGVYTAGAIRALLGFDLTAWLLGPLAQPLFERWLEVAILLGLFASPYEATSISIETLSEIIDASVDFEQLAESSIPLLGPAASWTPGRGIWRDCTRCALRPCVNGALRWKAGD